ncbi:MAG: hypothetical protein AVDCRST_MAG38-1202 [uncultured Solirubrobacteraceae bacterium]|uniref:Uncharacterized protein n=1 Tax=uncultured Solirubrobacteraceae bacterium TaxID=1162706 RepID=A0A6J4RIC9_9ACTN|nr:MAG: hypothetical protein AVDCRST_MAG38-1202 [uncultured Solirubrobacteraceae bacterium]
MSGSYVAITGSFRRRGGRSISNPRCPRQRADGSVSKLAWWRAR